MGEEKARRGIPIGRKENFVRKHPAVVAFLSTLAGGKALKGLGKGLKGAKKLFRKKPKKRSWFSKRANQDFSRNTSTEIKVANLVNKLDAKSLDTLYNDLVHN